MRVCLPGQVDVVEGHGTGTTLGDPIEAQALLATYGRDRPEGRPLWLGSVKSNIGHTQAAAGVAGVIKMVMAMRHGVLPRTLHVDEPSSQVDWSVGGVSLLTEERSWESDGEPRRAGVSSFGVTGTNAHVILEEAPSSPVSSSDGVAFGSGSLSGADTGRDSLDGDVVVAGVSGDGTGVGSGVLGGGVLPFVLSGRSGGALCAQAERLRERVVDDGGLGLGDVGYSLTGRSVFEHRAVVLGGDRDGLLDGLSAVVDGEGSVGGVVRGVASLAGDTGAVFLFPGQGSQWEGMALELLDCSRVFAERVRACGEALAEYVDWSLEDVLRGVEGAPGLDRVDVVQPVLFAVMVSLAALWRSCGVRPAMVVGHSQGEIAAAHVAGGLSLRDAARVVALRSRALVRLAGRGGMVSVASPAGELEELLQRFDDRVSLAAINGPSSVVVSGDPGALRELLVVCETQGVRAREIPVDYAAHSVQVEEIREELLDGCSAIAPRQGDVPFFSTVTGGLLDTSGLDGEYWYRNLRETVQLERSTRKLLEDGQRVFVEVSPHPVLTVGVQESVDAVLGDGTVGLVVGSLRREQGGPERFLGSLAELWTRGMSVDWDACFAGSGARRVGLPTYAFQHERFWLEGSVGVGDMVSAGQSPAAHPLLGAVVELADGGQWLFTGRISIQSHPWLADHAVLGGVLFPGTAFLELALCAGERVGCGVVRELTLEAPLLLSEDGAVQLQLSVGEPDESGRRPLSIYSRPQQSTPGDSSTVEEEWTRHASGVLAQVEAVLNGHAASLQQRAGLFANDSWPPRDARAIDLDGLYDALAEQGFEYGPAFQGLGAAWQRGEEVFAEIALSPDQQDEASTFGMHPALLDCAFHAGLSSLVNDDAEKHDQQETGVRLPFSFREVELYAPGASSLRVSLSSTADDTITLLVANEAGALVASIDSLAVREVSKEQLSAARGNNHDSLFQINWNTLPTPEPTHKETLTALSTANSPLTKSLNTTGNTINTYTDLQTLGEALEQQATPPETVLVDFDEIDGVGKGSAITTVVGGGDNDETGELASTRRGVLGVLSLLRGWLVDERFVGCRLVFVTRGGVGVGVEGGVSGLALSSVWGLVRSAQSESPGRFVLVDVDGVDVSWGVLSAAVGSGESQLAVREGVVYVPRLARAGSGALVAPGGGVGGWRLAAGDDGTFEGLSLVSDGGMVGPLGLGEVRVGVRAGGLNFRDVLIALGMYPGGGSVGGEGAGVVLEVGPGVEGLCVGDRVMGLLSGGLGPVSVTDHRLVTLMPEDWSFAQAAAIPVAFLTAYYGLVDLAGLGSGERVLVHAASGGVGMAAVQLARYLGAEVFGTASPGKWGVLRGLGLDEAHIASSRTLEFGERFLEQTGGRGVNVVLDSLAGEFVDASLELLREGGRFIEMGKTDIRDPGEVADRFPGVSYRAFDLFEAGPERIQEMLGELVGLFESGVLEPLPVRAWDVRRAPDAFRFMSQARHTGKIVLSVPSPGIDPDGTVLITGGTGTLGGLIARRLVSEHGVRHLLLVSRRGSRAPGADELRVELESLGARVRIEACDVSDREDLAKLVDSIAQEYPLRGVVHTAGVLDDGMIESLTAERIERVLAPKADAAWYLHELTQGMDLQVFVLFSSAAGALGGPGQGNYAAANAFLDALAEHRRAQGLAGVSLAWGLWEQTSEMTGGLSEADRSRMARTGIGVLPTERALELFDTALEESEALLLPVPLDLQALRVQARTGTLPSFLNGLVRLPTSRRSNEQHASLARRVRAAPENERESIVLELLRTQIAAVLGHNSPETIDIHRPFKDLGFDSLTAVELRNRLNTTTGLHLPATLIFDHPTTTTLTTHLLQQLTPDRTAGGPAAEIELNKLELVLSSMVADDAERTRITARLHAMLIGLSDSSIDGDADADDIDLDSATDDEMFDLIDRELGGV